MSRTVDPKNIKGLGDWASRWGNVKNLGFDADTREPIVFAKDGTTRVDSFPWRRERDTMTILTAPSRFTHEEVRVARERYTAVQTERTESAKGVERDLKLAEEALLEAWRQYHDPRLNPADRAGMRPRIQAAESAVRDLETSLVNAKYPKEQKLRQIVVSETQRFQTAYVPPFPTDKRGIPNSEFAQ